MAKLTALEVSLWLNKNRDKIAIVVDPKHVVEFRHCIYTMPHKDQEEGLLLVAQEIEE